MKVIGLCSALLICLLGLIGLVAPAILIDLSQHFVSRTGLVLAGVLRIGIGLVLLLAASRSRAPLFLRIVGVVAIIAGVATLGAGVERVQAIVTWAVSHGSWLVRLFALIPVIVGAFLVYSLFGTTESRTARS